MHPSTFRNRLAAETSLYLRQHAANPVDWYPWCDEALERARAEDRPILLSVGYSACHWCHVMERECFEDEAIAGLMNDLFVCIKVDREERPDVDHLYMKAVQGMTGRGGWPMTVFLTPSGEPFYAGTYFPPQDRGGMPGFPRVLEGVARAYAEQRQAVLESSRRVADFLRAEGEVTAAAGPTEDGFLRAAKQLTEALDPLHGGFGGAPKFPGSMSLSLLLDAELLEWNSDRRRLVKLALDRMAAGGIHDQLGGGFHRYSVDKEWLVPHFEKMLYDQALLASLYLDGYRFFGEERYRSVAAGIFEYVSSEMTSPEGGFYSAQDADSEGEEGKYFLWSQREITELLGNDAAGEFCRWYGVRRDGNFEGSNILHWPDADRYSSLSDAEREALEGRLRRGRRILLDARRMRVAPGRDEKILTDWNGLMIGALVRGSQVLGRADLLAAAVAAADFVDRSMTTAEGRLYHSYAGQTAKIGGFLDDYAFLGRARLELFAATGRRRDYEAAEGCARRLIEEFLHDSGAGFCFTATSSRSLLARTCELFDGAVPAGNSVACELLFGLWEITGEEEFRRAATGVVDRFLAQAENQPYGGSQLLRVAERWRRGMTTIAILPGEESGDSLLAAALDGYDSRRLVYVVRRPGETWLPAALRDKPATSRALAYVCEGASCRAAVADPQELRRMLLDGE